MELYFVLFAAFMSAANLYAASKNIEVLGGWHILRASFWLILAAVTYVVCK